MCTFFQHVSSAQLRDVFEAQPARIRPLVRVCLAHQTPKLSRFGRDELVQRVAEHFHASRGELPPDLRGHWMARRVALPSEPHPIIARIEGSDTLPENVDGVAAFATVTGVLSRRLSRGEARHLADNLPVDLAPLVRDYIDDRAAHASHFDHEEYLTIVARELDTDDVEEAEVLARAVFQAVEEYLRGDVYEHVMRQLPVRMQELWAV